MLPATRIVDPAGITVAVCHRDPLIQLGITAVLRDDTRFRLHHDGRPALDPPALFNAAGSTQVTVCDYDTGRALLRHTWGRSPPPRIMVVTPRDREADVQQALSQGILGYVLVGCRLDEVTDGLMALSRGQRFLTSSAAQRIADRFSYQALTNRETEVLHFVVAGWSNKMIANQLGVSEGTIKTHVKAILEKLGVGRRTEAANIATRRGLVTAENMTGHPATVSASNHGTRALQFAA